MERSSTLARKTQHKVKNGLRLAVTYLFLGLLGLVMVYPLLWMVASSFKENKGIFNSISIIPPSLSLEHYIEGWKGVGEYTFTTFFTNTFSIVIPSTVFIIVSCLLVAYGFARFEFPMKKFLFTAMMATLMLPSAVIIIPRYMLFKQFGWLDTYLPFIVPAMFAGNSFFIFQLVQFFRGIPRELWDDAMQELPEQDEQIDALLRRRLRSDTPDRDELRRASDYLYRRGFGRDEIRAAIARYQDNFEEY